MKNNKGITLIALIITIIVLLILAGVSIAMLAGDNNIFGRATEASTNTKLTNVQELIGVEISNAVTDYYDKKYVNVPAEGYTTGIEDIIAAAVKTVDLPTGVKAQWTTGDEEEEPATTVNFSEEATALTGYEYHKSKVKDAGAQIKLTLDGVETTGTFQGIALTWTAPAKAGT